MGADLLAAGGHKEAGGAAEGEGGRLAVAG